MDQIFLLLLLTLFTSKLSIHRNCLGAWNIGYIGVGMSGVYGHE